MKSRTAGITTVPFSESEELDDLDVSAELVCRHRLYYTFHSHFQCRLWTDLILGFYNRRQTWGRRRHDKEAIESYKETVVFCYAMCTLGESC